MNGAREPLISVIVCTLNEERYIEALLHSVLAQHDVPGSTEVIVVDGGSSDRTVELARSVGPPGVVRIVANPRRSSVFGFNIGASAARGRYLAYVGAHAEYGPRYLAACLEVMQRTGAANVGSVVRHEGHGTFGRAVAIAMSSPFGVGDSKFRHAKTEQDCDSVMGGFLQKRLFESLGGFNETNIINQDGEFNYRLRRAGHRIVVSPAIESTYYVRSSLSKLASQYRRYGYYRRWTEVQHPGSVPLRVYAPAALVAGLALSGGAFALTRTPLALALPGAYAAFLSCAAWYGVGRAREPKVGLLVPLATAIMHISFGFGWLTGFATLRKPKSRYGPVAPATSSA